MPRIRVTLGERETDVLTWLVKECTEGVTYHTIIDAMVERGVSRENTLLGVHRAIHTLRALDFVTAAIDSNHHLVWRATPCGCQAITQAARDA